MLVHFYRKHVRLHDSGCKGEKFVPDEDRLRCIKGVFRCVQEEWNERNKSCHDEWKDWELIPHLVDYPMQPNGNA